MRCLKWGVSAQTVFCPFGDLKICLHAEHRGPSSRLPHVLKQAVQALSCLARSQMNVSVVAAAACTLLTHYKNCPLVCFSCFSKNIPSPSALLNGLFSLTALGAAPSPSWTQPNYPIILQLHGRGYPRRMDGFVMTTINRLALPTKRALIWTTLS